MFLKFED